MHECVFCDQRRISGFDTSVNAAAVHRVIENGKLKIENGENPQILEIAFYGGSFTALTSACQDELLMAAQPFIQQNAKNSIRISTRPDCIDKHTVERLKILGVKTIELGAQSMCNEVLEASQRGHKSSDVERAAEIIKASGLSLVLQMMTGLPGDSREKSLSTAEQFVRLKPDGVRIYPTVVVYGTRLHAMWLSGEYKEQTLQDAVELCAELCAIFEEADVPVIRIGLNPTESLSAADAVAGAYHPALGELVYSKIYYNKAAALLGGVAPGSDVTISVAKGRVSIMTGQRRKNLEGLKTTFSLRSIKVMESESLAGKQGEAAALSITAEKRIEKP